MKTPLVLIATLLVAAPVAIADAPPSCASLAVTGDGSPGSELTFDLTGGAVNAPAFLGLSKETGNTTLSFGILGTLDLGLAMPIIPLPLGMTDGNGDVSLTVTVPPGALPQVDLHAQGVTVDVSFSPPDIGFDFCTSNVVGFSVG